MSDYWSIRYNAARVPPAPLHLKAPLERVWKYKPKGSLVGFVRAGQGAVFATGGKGPARLDPASGKPVWTVAFEADLLIPRSGDILAWSMQGTQAIDMSSGEVRWKRDVSLGMNTSCLVGELLVGVMPDALQVVNLATLENLWRVERLILNAPVSDGQVAIIGEDSVCCYDLHGGAVRWQHPGSDFGGKCWQMGFIWRDLFVVKIGEPLLLTAFDVKTGKTVWRTDFPVQWCEPYGERAYGIEAKGAYKILDLATGKIVFEKVVEKVPPPESPRKGLVLERDPDAWPWRDTLAAVTETHTFLVKRTGQIIALKRDSGELEQVVEIEGMPASLPIIYENRLLLTDFNASVYCFEGAP